MSDNAALPRLPMTRPSIDEATIAGVVEVLRSGWITSGPKVSEFQNALSQLFGGRPVRAFNSGTCTMEIALRIAGIGTSQTRIVPHDDTFAMVPAELERLIAAESAQEKQG